MFDAAYEAELIRRGLIPPRDRVDLERKILSDLAVQPPQAPSAALPGEGPVPKAKRQRRAKVSEKEFQQQVIDFAHLHGWKVAWFRPVRVQRADGSVYYETPVGADGKGWPDLILVKGVKIVAAELKVGKNTTSPEQDRWLAVLATCCIPAFVWTPSTWEEISECLT
jgi:hypothetical protein